jgi:hypothetical protein
MQEINHKKIIYNVSFESVAKFKYFETSIKTCVYENIKSRLNFGNTYYRFVQNILPSLFFSKNLKLQIYSTIILPVVLYGCETCCVTLMENYRLSVFENRVLRKIFGPKKD